jgi:peptide/nickel transport system ATP-binding protein
MSSFQAYFPPPPEEIRGGAAQPLLIAQNLKKYFPVRGGILNRVMAEVKAVDDVSFEIRKGEVLGIVGESGCGKSTTARLVMQLIALDTGTLVYDGDPVGQLRGISVASLRKQVQMVFQESFASLNPRLTVGDSISYAPKMHGLSNADAEARTQRLLREVGLNPTQYMRRYPHELSGGQRQRVNIARALALQPKLLILDESVSALDKSVEAQVLNLLVELKQKFDLTYMFISHDLNVVEFISDHVMVMYLGKVVETGPVDEIYRNARHPYTRALLKSKPSFDPAQRTREMPLTGDPPSPLNPPSGCRFRTRCRFAEAVCASTEPPLLATPDSPPRHQVACHIFKSDSGHSQAISGASDAAG